MATQEEPPREIITSGSDDSYERHSVHLPDCLLLEILCRLPAKSVFRVKCVSKHWHALISDPSFMRFCRLRFKVSLPWTLYFRFVDFNGYCNWHVTKELLGVHYGTSNHSAFKSPLFPGIPFYDQQEKLQCVASSGDLLLFVGHKWERHPKALYYVCNPFISQWIELPPLPHPRHAEWGLGFISRVENGVAHYKVVRITHISYKGPPEHSWEQNIFHLQIFSSETGRWRNLKASLPKLMGFLVPPWPAVAYNGCLHWIQHRLGKMIVYDPNNETDRCRIINMPIDRENHRMNGMNAALGVCRGRLCYFEAARIFMEPGRLGSWRMWVLKDYEKGEWSLEHRGRAREICSLNACPASIHSSRRVLTPVAFHPFNLDIMYFWCQGYILSFNLRTGWFEAEFYPGPAAVKRAWIFSWVVFPIMLPPSTTPAPSPWWKTAAERKEKKGKLGRIWKGSFPCICKEK